MKKLSILVFAIALALGMGIYAAPAGVASAKDLDYGEYDQVFLNTLDEFAAENFGGGVEAVASKEIIYDVDLQSMGYVYDFTANGVKGFAIVINASGVFEVAEFYFDAVNPYGALNDEKRVYVNYSIYLYNDGEGFFQAETGCPVAENVLAAMSDLAYYSAASVDTSGEHIYYTSKDENRYNMALRYPGCTEVGGLTNECAPIAGGNIIQYFDRFKENLIPNFTPGSSLSNQYIYKTGDTELSDTIRQLYSDMKTNTSGDGTSVAQFKTGMETFCTRQGYTYSQSKCMSGSSFDYSTAKQRLQSGQPLVLFLYGWSALEIDSSANNDDYLMYVTGEGRHAMAGFGFNEISYTLTSGGSRTDKYIAVASGNGLVHRGYFNINLNTVIEDAYSVNIA